MDERKQAFIEFMMASDVLRFGSFVTKSGRNTPYFINTGNYRTGKQIATLAKFYGDFMLCLGQPIKGFPWQPPQQLT